MPKTDKDKQIYPKSTIKNWIIENWKQVFILQEGDGRDADEWKRCGWMEKMMSKEWGIV